MMFFRKKNQETQKQLLVTDVVLFLFFFASVLLFWQTGWLVALIGFGIVLIGFFFFHEKEDIIFFLLAAILGSVSEMIAIYFGLWKYTEPVVWGLPLWAPLFWGFSFLFGRRVRDAIFKLSHVTVHYSHHKKVKHYLSFLFFDGLLYVLTLVLVLGLWQSNIILSFLLLILLLAVLSVYHNPEDIFFTLFAMAIGVFVELTSVKVGVWGYSNSVFFGIPLWIPLLYGIFALIVRRTAITLNLVLKK